MGASLKCPTLVFINLSIPSKGFPLQDPEVSIINICLFIAHPPLGQLCSEEYGPT